MKLLSALILTTGFLAVVSCGIKIETGRTVEEAAESNEKRASRIRASWAIQLRNAPAMTRGRLVKTHVDSVTAMFFRFGYRIVNEWQDGNKGRGEPVDASEMRQVVDSWVSAERPILKAYEDNLEYGLRFIRDSLNYDQKTLELFDQFSRAFYDSRSIVFYPNKDVTDYEGNLIEIERKIRRLSDDLDKMLRVYSN